MELPYPLPKDTVDRQQLAAYCVERWAARLSRGPDRPQDVVEATMIACDGSILEYEAAKAKDDGKQPDFAAAKQYWRNRAFFIIVQARAGDCYKDA